MVIEFGIALKLSTSRYKLKTEMFLVTRPPTSGKSDSFEKRKDNQRKKRKKKKKKKKKRKSQFVTKSVGIIVMIFFM